MGRDGHAVAAVARDFGVGWATVMAAVREHGARLLEQARLGAQATAIGVDETAFTRGTVVKPTVFATDVVDLHAGRLIDVIEGRSRKCWPTGCLTSRPSGGLESRWRRWIRSAAMVRLLSGFPHAVRVLDPFHVVRLGFACVDGVRRRVQQETYGHRGRRGHPLYGIGRVLRRGAENLTPPRGCGYWPVSKPATITPSRRRLAGRAGTARHLPLRRSRPRGHTPVWLDGLLHRPDLAEIARLARTISTWRRSFWPTSAPAAPATAPPKPSTS